MKMNSAGQVVIKETDAIEALYQGKSINNIVVEDTKWISRYNTLADLFDFPDSKINYELASTLSSSEFVEDCIADWNMPAEYYEIDIRDYCLNKIGNKMTTEYKRVCEELVEFEKRNMTPVLQFLIYFVDRLKENKIVWGVGRGSSVASYVLFLIGVHRIDSIKYDLDIKEFLK